MGVHRLRAPSNDGALLAEPPLENAAGTLDENSARLGAWSYDFQGRDVQRLRAMARVEAVAQARKLLGLYGCNAPGVPSAGPDTARLVVTGHQPELFHPGVWVKNFAASLIARQSGSVGLNLIVDNDILKAPGIRVPRRVGDSLRVERVEYDEWRGEVPYEDLTVADESAFLSFADRVRDCLRGVVADPVLDDFWPRAVAAREQTDRLGYRFAMARHGVETEWGVCNLELPLSLLCETEAFLWFVSHVLAHLDRFRSVHNAALADYRDAYGIRSRHHPVPELARRGEWIEAPFWTWRAGKPRRRPLLVRTNSQGMQLRIDGEDAPLLELPLGADRDACCAVERLQTLPSMGVRLRTRALTTTMFARLLLGDLFLHGIGGAKYDELGDAIIRGFFGFEPPAYMTMSMTLWLGLGDDSGAAARLARVDRALRDLEWKPELQLDAAVNGTLRAAMDRKRAAIAAPVATHEERLHRFRTIRQCNEELAEPVAGLRQELVSEREHVLADARRDSVARSREFSLVLHSRARLRDVLQRVIPGLGKGCRG